MCRDPAGYTSEEELLKVTLSTSLQEHKSGVVSVGTITASGHGNILNPHSSAFSLLGQGQGAAVPQRCGGHGGQQPTPGMSPQCHSLPGMTALSCNVLSPLSGPITGKFSLAFVMYRQP